jgi:chromosome segregation ATPase
MELNSIFLCTTIGALTGTMAGVLLMSRKIRLPISAGDLSALRTKLQAAESSLAAASTAAEDLRKQLDEREQTLQQTTAELKTKAESLDRATQDAEKEKLQRAVNEQLSQELNTQNAALLKERNDLEAKFETEKKLAVEKTTQLVSAEAQLDAANRQITELTGRLEGLIAEGAAMRRFREQESRHRASLEEQLAAEQDRVQQLARQVAELENGRSVLELKLEEERQSAARGMELLLRAQENFSRVLNPVNGEVRNGELRHLTVEPPGSIAEAADEPVVSIQSVAAAD